MAEPAGAKRRRPASQAAGPARVRARRPVPTDAPVAAAAATAPAIDLDRYSPAYFTFIANKLARGASAHYLAT